MKGGTEECVRRLRALGDPTRLQVVELLMEGGATVGELNASLGLEPSLLSHHLRVLRVEGLVVAQRRGKSVLYALAPELLERPSDRSINLGCCVMDFGVQKVKEPE